MLDDRFGAHRVTVTTTRCPRTTRMPGGKYRWEFVESPAYEVVHPDQCNALPYGDQCWFDRLADGLDDWPKAAGVYTAHLQYAGPDSFTRWEHAATSAEAVSQTADAVAA